jgi:hypothetical protein
MTTKRDTAQTHQTNPNHCRLWHRRDGNPTQFARLVQREARRFSRRIQNSNIAPTDKIKRLANVRRVVAYLLASYEQRNAHHGDAGPASNKSRAECQVSRISGGGSV